MCNEPSDKSEEGLEMEVTTIAIDLAKNVFALCGADADGQIVLRKELRRAQLSSFMRKLGPGVIGMEASGGAHHWARQMAPMGHEVRLISPALVKPYRKGNKTDRNDAEAILEAMTRPTMRFVADQERSATGHARITPSTITIGEDAYSSVQSVPRFIT
jgi:transposase